MNEIKELEKTKTMRKIEKIFKRKKLKIIRSYLLYSFTWILIATPLSDEIGVSLLAGFTTIKTKTIAILGFVLNSIIIFLILYFSSRI